MAFALSAACLSVLRVSRWSRRSRRGRVLFSSARCVSGAPRVPRWQPAARARASVSLSDEDSEPEVSAGMESSSGCRVSCSLFLLAVCARPWLLAWSINSSASATAEVSRSLSGTMAAISSSVMRPGKVDTDSCRLIAVYASNGSFLRRSMSQTGFRGLSHASNVSHGAGRLTVNIGVPHKITSRAWVTTSSSSGVQKKVWNFIWYSSPASPSSSLRSGSSFRSPMVLSVSMSR